VQIEKTKTLKILQVNQILLRLTQSSDHSTSDLLAALAESILTTDAVERLVKTCQCPLVSAQYLMLVNRLRASAPCLEALEMVLTERVFTDGEEDSGKRALVVVDVWQPLFLKVGATEQCCLLVTLIQNPGYRFFRPGPGSARLN
jgi:hypothetical protein